MKTQCPSLSPRCDGELRISECETRLSIGEDGKEYDAPFSGRPKSARCQKCGKLWTREHLDFEGINIDEVQR